MYQTWLVHCTFRRALHLKVDQPRKVQRNQEVQCTKPGRCIARSDVHCTVPAAARLKVPPTRP